MRAVSLERKLQIINDVSEDIDNKDTRHELRETIRYLSIELAKLGSEANRRTGHLAFKLMGLAAEALRPVQVTDEELETVLYVNNQRDGGMEGK